MATNPDPSVPDLWFAFPDGVFHYACAECDALCCRGQGFAGNLRREMGQLLTLYPELQSMVINRRGEIVTVSTPAGRCHFLDADNSCRIEKQHGKALKPGVCSLFPFNVFTRIGKVIAVSPHFMCPLRLQIPARPGLVEGTHALLEPAIRESGLLDGALSSRESLISSVHLHPSAPAKMVLVRETHFRDLCSGAISQQSFGETLRTVSSDPDRLDTYLARAAALLGLSVATHSRPYDFIDDLLHALALPLRLNLLRLSSEGILLALALAEVVLRRVARLSDCPPTPQGAHQIISSVLPALYLLACFDEPVVVPPNAYRHVPPFGDPQMTFVGYRVLKAPSPIPAILDLLEPAMENLSTVADRTAFLVEMGNRIGPSAKKLKPRPTLAPS